MWGLGARRAGAPGGKGCRCELDPGEESIEQGNFKIASFKLKSQSGSASDARPLTVVQVSLSALIMQLGFE